MPSLLFLLLLHIIFVVVSGHNKDYGIDRDKWAKPSEDKQEFCGAEEGIFRNAEKKTKKQEKTRLPFPATRPFRVLNNTALIVVDVQNCFIVDDLPVKRAKEIVAVVNKLIERFSLVVYTIDSHPAEHISFKKNHDTSEENVVLRYTQNGKLCDAPTWRYKTEVEDCGVNPTTLSQTLWPKHCVENTNMVDLYPEIKVDKNNENIFLYKGGSKYVDSYSGFFDNLHSDQSKLMNDLRHRNVTNVFVVGVATDFCVLATSLDAVSLGLQTYVVSDATASVGSKEEAFEKMKRHDVLVVDSSDVENILKTEEKEAVEDERTNNKDKK